MVKQWNSLLQDGRVDILLGVLKGGLGKFMIRLSMAAGSSQWLWTTSSIRCHYASEYQLHGKMDLKSAVVSDRHLLGHCEDRCWIRWAFGPIQLGSSYVCHMLHFYRQKSEVFTYMDAVHTSQLLECHQPQSFLHKETPEQLLATITSAV